MCVCRCSGKTHTILGRLDRPGERGLIPRILEDLARVLVKGGIRMLFANRPVTLRMLFANSSHLGHHTKQHRFCIRISFSNPPHKFRISFANSPQEILLLNPLLITYQLAFPAGPLRRGGPGRVGQGLLAADLLPGDHGQTNR